MGRGYEEEKLFSENIDRLLAGKDVTGGPEIDEDTRTALDFARRMTELRVSPSSGFQAYLKARLTEKLNEQESAARRGWFWKLIPREPVWQAVTVLAIMFIVGGVLWGTIFNDSGSQLPNPTQTTVVSAPTSTTPAATTAPVTSVATTTTAAPTASATTTTVPASSTAAPGYYLVAQAGTDKAVYLKDDIINISLSVHNYSSQTFISTHQPIISLMQKSTGQPVYTFADNKGDWSLGSGETRTINYSWTQLDENGRTVAPGTYFIELEDLDYKTGTAADSPHQSLKLNLSQPVYFEISDASPAAGVRVLTPNQTLLFNGITVTLQKIEFSEHGVYITAVVTPPSDYVLLPPSPELKAAQDYRAAAGYSVDGGWVQDIGISSVEYYSDRMVHSWYIPNPVPNSAQKLTFVVNEIGNWSGPWQFTISLAN